MSLRLYIFQIVKYSMVKPFGTVIEKHLTMLNQFLSEIEKHRTKLKPCWNEIDQIASSLLVGTKKRPRRSTQYFEDWLKSGKPSQIQLLR